MVGLKKPNIHILYTTDIGITINPKFYGKLDMTKEKTHGIVVVSIAPFMDLKERNVQE